MSYFWYVFRNDIIFLEVKHFESHDTQTITTVSVQEAGIGGSP